MRRYAGHRIVQFLPTLFGITLLTFLLLRIAPGDPISLMGEVDMNAGFAKKSLDAWRTLKGLDDPLLVQYANWLARIFTLDFGRSFIDERLVTEMIAEAAPNTLLLNGLALVAIYVLAIPLGMFSAVKRGTRIDRGLSTGLFVLYSLPAFWTALVLILLFGGGSFLDIFPIRGLHSDGMDGADAFTRFFDTAWHLVLPVFCLTYPAMARTSRFQRSAMLEVIRQDFIRTARAKGLTERVVLVRHALKASLLPIATLLSLDLPVLVGGSLIVERIFTIRGMGMLMFEAILRRDYPVIMGVVTLVAVVTMVAVLLGDLALAWLDPRIREANER